VIERPEPALAFLDMMVSLAKEQLVQMIAMVADTAFPKRFLRQKPVEFTRRRGMPKRMSDVCVIQDIGVPLASFKNAHQALIL